MLKPSFEVEYTLICSEYTLKFEVSIRLLNSNLDRLSYETPNSIPLTVLALFSQEKR